jgi:hypothetical protein
LAISLLSEHFIEIAIMMLIDGFVLLQVNILGQCIPPENSVKEILNEFKKEEDVYRFINMSNLAISRIDRRYNPHLYIYESLEEYEKRSHLIFIQIQMIVYRQAEILGSEVFLQLSESEALCFWYRFFTGYIKGLDLDKISRVITHKTKVAKGNTPFELTKSNTINLDDKLFKYPSFVTAYSFDKFFNTRARNKALVDSEMNDLELRRYKLHKIYIELLRSKKNEQDNINGNSQVALESICPICQEYFKRKPGVKQETCGFKECQTKHETISKRENRELNQRFDSKRIIMADREKVNGSKPISCKDCGEKRVLYKPEYWCKKCIIKNHSS